MGEFVDILNNDLGSSVRAKLNNLASDSEISFHVVSEFAEIANEVNYFRQGAIVFSIAEQKWYKRGVSSWAISEEFPVKNYEEVAEIDNTDSPYSPLDEKTIIGDTSSGNITINLPAISGISGRRLNIKNIGSGVITVDASTTETIDGDLTIDVIQLESISIIASSSGWYIL